MLRPGKGGFPGLFLFRGGGTARLRGARGACSRCPCPSAGRVFSPWGACRKSRESWDAQASKNCLHVSEGHRSPSLRVRAGGQHVPVRLKKENRSVSQSQDSKTETRGDVLLPAPRSRDPDIGCKPRSSRNMSKQDQSVEVETGKE